MRHKNVSKSSWKGTIVFPNFSFFVENGHVEHTGTGFLDHRNLRCNVHFVHDDIELLDVARFNFGGILSIGD